MKKFFTIMAMALGLVLFSACKDTPGVTYNATVTGDAHGEVALVYPYGHLNLNGDAALDFLISNDTTKVAPANGTLTLAQAYDSKDTKTVQAAFKIQEDLTKQFNVTAASGTYDVTLDGTATAYGVTLSIHEHWTNKQ